MSKISIIMPVYNGAKWLDESINSVLEQSFKDFELICINDSSTDNSKEILEKYSKQDLRVKYFTKENEGPGVALNYGIKKAQGKYLCFIDQDDKYAPDYLEKMFNTIEKTKCDLCICRAYFWENDNITEIPYPKINAKNNIVDIKTSKKKKLFSGHFFPQWTKIINKDFFIENKIEFPNRENKAHDVPVHYQLIGLCDKIGYVEEQIYFHRMHPNQISYNFDTSLFYLMSVKEILVWLEINTIISKRKKTIKEFLKYLIINSANAAKNETIFDELLKILSNNYGSINNFEIKRYILRKYKKFIKNKKESILKLQKIKNAIVGKNSYCATQPHIATRKTIIGSFCSIGKNVQIGHGEHPLNFLSTSPYFYFDALGWKTETMPSYNEYWGYKPVKIGNDVWIGDNVVIKNGINIGDGAVIGLNSVVTKDIPPYAIVAGVPARIIKYRFDEKTIEKLLKLKWWELDDERIKQLPYDKIEKILDTL